ncbi:Crp/Fnr family transcriptional regulator [uncultured Kordia sp.]|uniref:Crp/Fnr family transcriptional regulator n=1 Tax=uncultured Kordia sp. TaxID=507699 RepID=UPI00262CC817|nr:Crp/Fnr family transcriptional regulator [uncultured Kordia sp.]
MDEDVFGLALDYFVVKEIKKGDFLLKEGKVCHQIAYIEKGLFRTYFLKDGNEVNTCFCMEDSITLSHKSFVNRVASTEYIQAIEDAKVVTLSYDNLIKLYQLDYAWQSLSNVLTERECIRLSERINAMSFETAKEKYLHLLEKQPEIIQRVSIQHIASYIGVSRETVSRIRSKILL